MKRKDKTSKLNCGCQTLMISHNPWPPPRQHWRDTISFQDLKTDLGPSNEAWFDNLTSEHDQHQKVMVHADRQPGRSPCPSGGVLHVAASTPCPEKKVLQYDSPALWPTLLPESPVLESTSLSKSASSEDEGHNNSAATSFGFGLDGFNGDGRGDKHQLLAFSMDSADLSWSSSMATPPNVAMEKFPVTEEEERQKGPARVLFSPNTSAEDSELSEMDVNMTIEQEEASMSLFAPDVSLTAPQATCWCRKTERREYDSDMRAKPCSCEQCQVPVVEIHCSENKSGQSPSFDINKNTKSRVRKEADHQDMVPGSLLEKEWPSPQIGGEERVLFWQTSTPRTGRLKFVSLRDNCPDRDVRLTRRCNSLTPTPERKGNSTLSSHVPQLDSPFERTPIGQRSPVSVPGASQVSSNLAHDNAGGGVRDIPKQSHLSDCHDILKPEFEVAGLDLKTSVSSAGISDQIVDDKGWQTPRQGNGSLHFNTSTPKPDAYLSSQMSSVNDAPGFETQHYHRKSLKKRGTPKNLATMYKSEKTMSVDEALADFFSSPETSAKQRRHAPGKGAKRSSPISAPGNSDREEPVTEADVELDFREDQLSVNGKVGVRENPQSRHILVENSVNSKQVESLTEAGVSGHHVEEPEIHISNSAKAVEQNVLTENSTFCKTDRISINNNKSEKAPLRDLSIVKTDMVNYASPLLSTPPSILRSAGKQRQMPPSLKRVRFAADCQGKVSIARSKDRLRRKLAAHVGDGEKERQHEGEASAVTTVCSSDAGAEFEVKKDGVTDCEKAATFYSPLAEDCSAPTLMTSETVTPSAAKKVQDFDAARLHTIQACAAGIENADVLGSQAAGAESADTSRSQAAEPESTDASRSQTAETEGADTSRSQAVEPESTGTSRSQCAGTGSTDTSRSQAAETEGADTSRSQHVETESTPRSQHAETDSAGHSSVSQEPLIPPNRDEIKASSTRTVPPTLPDKAMAENVLHCAGQVLGQVPINSMQSPLMSPPVHQTVPQSRTFDSLNQARGSVRKTPDGSLSHDAGGASDTQKGPKVLSTLELQSVEMTQKIGKEQMSGGNKAENTITSVKSVGQPKLRLGLRKTPRFLYPSSSQILETCPQNVYDFKAAGAAVKPPADTVLIMAADDKLPTVLEGTQPSMTSPSEKSHRAARDTSDHAVSHVHNLPVIETSSTPITTNKNDIAFGNDSNWEKNAVEMDRSETSAKNEEDTPFNVSMLEYEQMVMEEDPDWSEIDVCAMEECDVGTAMMVDGQKLKTTLDKEVCNIAQVPASDGLELDRKEGSSYGERLGEAAASHKLEDRVAAQEALMLSEVTSSLKTTCSPADQRGGFSSNPVLAHSTSHSSPFSSAAHSSPVACHLTTTGLSTTLTASSASVQASHWPLSTASSVAQPYTKGCQKEREPSPADQQADLQEELQKELLCDVDFSQELLSQSKSGIETEQKAGTDGVIKKLSDRRMLSKSVTADQSVSNLYSEMQTHNGKEKDCWTASEISASEKLRSEVFQASVNNSNAENPSEKSPEEPALESKPVKSCGDVLPPEVSTSPESLQLDQHCLGLKESPKPSFDPCLQRGSAPGIPGNKSPTVPGRCVGFTSAAGRQMKPTEKALAAAKALFLEEGVTVDEAGLHSDGRKASNSFLCDTDATGFSHRLSGKDLRMDRFLSPDQCAVSSGSCGTDDVEKTKATSSFSGFKSASGKDVILSLKGQRRAEEMWKAVEEELQSDQSLLHDAGSSPTKMAHSLASDIATEMKSSNNHSIPSKAATFEDEGPAHAEVSSRVESPGPSLQTLSSDMGFKTAGGKAVSLSSKAQQRAMELWKCVEKELSVSTDSVPEDQPACTGPGRSDVSVPLISKTGSSVESVVGTERVGKSCEKSNSSFKAPLVSGPSRSVPQGFRPFKSPRLVKKGPGEDRHIPKETEQSAGNQENSILHYFSKVGLKEGNGSAKRKHSDDFSDDDEYAWDIESIERMDNHDIYQTDEDRTIKPSMKVEPQLFRAAENQTQTQHSAQQAGEKKTGREQLFPQNAEPFPGSLHNVDANLDSTNLMDEEMSDAVLTEFSHDMYEATQAEPMPQKLVLHPLQQKEKSAFADSQLGLDEEFLRHCSGTTFDIPSQGSHKSVGVVSVSFESLRCDENISYEEKDSTTSHTDLSTFSNCEEEAQDKNLKDADFIQDKSLDIRELDFDSSIPDQIADSTFGDESVRNEMTGEGQDLEIDSSYLEKDTLNISYLEKDTLNISCLEKDTLNISCLEKELDTSGVEVSGGVVWVESKEGDLMSRQDAAATVMSLDAAKEEKSSEAGLEETENNLLQADDEMKETEEMFTEEFDTSGSCVAMNSEPVDGKLAKRKAEPVTLSSDETLSQSTKRPRTVAVGVCPGSDVRGIEESPADKQPRDISSDVSADGNAEEEGASLVESLADLSWTDITSTFNPSQCEGGKNAKADDVTEQNSGTDDSKQHGQQIDAGGDFRVPVPFLAYSSSSKSTSFSKTGVTKTAGSSSKMDLALVANGPDETEEGVMKVDDVLYTAFEHDADENQFCADSEGFQSTVGLSQLFSTQVSQATVIKKQNSSGDAQSVDADWKTFNTETAHSQGSSAQQEELDPVNDSVGDSTTLTSRTDASLKDVHTVLASENDFAENETHFRGFCTAQGNLLQVSKKSLEKAQTLFQDDSKITEGLAADSVNPGSFEELSVARPCGPRRLLEPSVTQLKAGDGSHVQRPEPGSGTTSRGGALNLMSRPSEKVDGCCEKDTASLALTKDSSSSLSFGFQTASGKSVAVSEKSVEKVRHLFDNDSEVENSEGTLKPVSLSLITASESFCGFKTAAGGDAAVSETSLNPVRSVLERELGQAQSSDKDNADEWPGPPSRSKLGFQTARGESVTASEKSLNHARDLFQAGTDQAGATESEAAPHQSSLLAPGAFVGFQTASGTSVSVSKNALAHVRSLFSSDDNWSVRGNEQSVQTMEEEQAVPKCAEFQTPRGQKSLSHAKAVLSKCSEEQGFSSENERNSGTGTTLVTSDVGFQTASGGKVSVSTKSLQHARKVRASTENKKVNEIDCLTLSKNGDGDSAAFGSSEKKFQGFQTAGGKSVSVSENALKNARRILDSSEISSTSTGQEAMISENHKISPPAPQGLGFETAREGSVTVSREALQHSQRTLRADGGLRPAWNVELEAPKPKSFGFQTASGNSVSVSHRSLQHAQNLLKDDTGKQNSGSILDQGTSPEINELETPKPKMFGFQTAGGHSMSVSHRSLQHAQNLLKGDTGKQNCGSLLDQGTTSEIGELEAPNPEMFGFQTAGGHSVNISHRALQHAQSLLKDDMGKEITGSLLDQGTSPEIRTSVSTQEPGNLLHASGITHQPTAHSEPDSYPVPTSGWAASPGASSLQQVHRLHAEDTMPPGCQGSGTLITGQERRGKEHLQPIVSDDGRALGEVGEEMEPSCHRSIDKDAAAQQRVAVKRTALYADSEAVLHDRSAKRFKLKAATAYDGNIQNISLALSMPRTPHHSSTPRCTTSGKSTPAFQPPYKKAKFAPPTAKKSGDDVCSVASGKPGYKPPPTLPTLHNTPGKARAGSSAQGISPSKTEPRREIPQMRASGGGMRTHFSEADRNGAVLSELWMQGTSGEDGQSCSPCESSKPQPGSDGWTVSGRSQSEQIMQNADQSELVLGHTFGIEEARMRQEKIISQKKRQKVRPVQGRWLTQKLTKPQMNLEDLQLKTNWRCRKELLRLGVSPAVCSVNSRNAEDFRFHLPSFYPGRAPQILVGDGALLVADKYGYAGKEEFYLAFLTVDGVDPGLVSETWLSNHYRWIVWKLAAYEVALPHSFAARALTPDTVMFQLKYRYDREVDGCQRSALKRIVERDDTPCKRMVLCVADIQYTEDAGVAMLEVTDGWYSLPCKPDPALQDLIGRKRLAVGEKIITTGAELAGSQEACSPLEICAGLHLKVFGNSTRPAPARVRLGYQRRPTPLCVPLSSLHPQGGLVGCLDIVVVRKYPLMIMEKLSEGGCVFRTLEMEEKVRRKHEEKRQAIMEKLCSQLQAEMEKEEESTKRGSHKRSLSQQEIQSLMTGAEISEALETVAHPEELQGMLSSRQIEQLMNYRQRQQEERQQRLSERLQEAVQLSSSQVERYVVPLQKLRIVGCCRRDIDSKTGLMLTVWRPGQDWESVQEGKRYRIYSLTAAPARCHALGQHVEVTASRQTRLQAASIEENLLDLVYEPREVYCVADLQQKAPPYSEFDFVGMVVSIKTALRGSDAVYAVDIKGDLLLIWFWGGQQAFSLQDTLTEGTAFAASNLRFKSCRKESVECCASLELSHFSLAGKTAAQRLMLQPFKQKDWKTQLLEQGREKLSRLKSASRPSTAPVSEMMEDLPPSFLDKLLAPLTQESTATAIQTTPSKDPLNTSINKSLDTSTTSDTSLNTSSASTQALSPSTQERRRKTTVQKEKLARLQSYSRPPPLSPLPCLVSPATAIAFKPPTPRRK